jgi:hypothetical protein
VARIRCKFSDACRPVVPIRNLSPFLPPYHRLGGDVATGRIMGRNRFAYQVQRCCNTQGAAASLGPTVTRGYPRFSTLNS